MYKDDEDDAADDDNHDVGKVIFRLSLSLRVSVDLHVHMHAVSRWEQEMQDRSAFFYEMQVSHIHTQPVFCQPWSRVRICIGGGGLLHGVRVRSGSRHSAGKRSAKPLARAYRRPRTGGSSHWFGSLSLLSRALCLRCPSSWWQASGTLMTLL